MGITISNLNREWHQIEFLNKFKMADRRPQVLEMLTKMS